MRSNPSREVNERFCNNCGSIVPRPHCARQFLSHDQRREETSLCSLLRATEYLYLENIALKLVLGRRQVANWQKLLDHLLTDEEIMAGVRLKFSDLYRDLEASKDPSSALDAFLGGLPAARKAH